MRHEQVLHPKIEKVSVIIEGKPNQLYAQGMRSFEQYDETRKYFAEGKQKDDSAENAKHWFWDKSITTDNFLNHFANESSKGTMK